MLQTRNGKRTPQAAIKIACDLIDEGMKSEEEALLMLDPKQLDALLHPQFDAEALKKATPVASALAASPGAACGKIVFTAEDAVEQGKAGEKVVLVRLETSPEDIEGMQYAQGILTVRGGMTSHAAVVARGMGTCCVSGCGAITMDEANKRFTLAGREYHEGDYISWGRHHRQHLRRGHPHCARFHRGRLLRPHHEAVGQVPSAGGPHQRRHSPRRQAGCGLRRPGIGLCRTEHMFFDPDRIAAIREMICSDTVEQRKAALAKLEPMQQGDFEQLYEALEGKHVNIRVLDPPLHEVRPHRGEGHRAAGQDPGKTVDEIKAIISSLHEFNPMMGHRGCRLAVTYPEIAEMQTEAVIKAAINVNKAHPDWNIVPEIMIPLVGDVKELKFVKKTVVATADKIIAEAGVDLKYKVGTMIEIPRAAPHRGQDRRGGRVLLLRYQRPDPDDLRLLPRRRRQVPERLLREQDLRRTIPSPVWTRKALASWVKMASEKGRATRPDIILGICGEHGGDPTTIEFCHNVGLTYVSCSPFRVPIARSGCRSGRHPRTPASNCAVRLR